LEKNRERENLFPSNVGKSGEDVRDDPLGIAKRR